MAHSLSDMFWDKRTCHLKLPPHHVREKQAAFTAGTATFLILKLNKADLSILLWAEQNTCREMGKKGIPAAGDVLCQEQQARKDASPYAVWTIFCNTWVSSHWLLLATALWIFTGSSLSSPLAPHPLPTVMSLSTAPWVTVQSRNGKTGLSWEPDKVMRAGPVAITKTSCSPVLSRQGKSNKKGLRSS